MRQTSVREHFEEIVWVTLGQTPSAEHVQSMALQQLNGTRFSGDEPAEQRCLELQHAMKQKKLLLVIDDCWDPEHERLLNFVDIESGSKVLLSSRVRNVIEGDPKVARKQKDLWTFARHMGEADPNWQLVATG